jgi:Actin
MSLVCLLECLFGNVSALLFSFVNPLHTTTHIHNNITMKETLVVEILPSQDKFKCGPADYTLSPVTTSTIETTHLNTLVMYPPETQRDTLLVECMERWQLPSVLLIESSRCCLFAYGITTGCVIEIHETQATVSCFLESHLIATTTFLTEQVNERLGKVLYHAIQQAPFDQRMFLWENMILSSPVVERDVVEQCLKLYVCCSETCHETQPKEIKWARLPDYFVAYKDRLYDAAFLGGVIVARVSVVVMSLYAYS